MKAAIFFLLIASAPVLAAPVQPQQSTASTSLQLSLERFDTKHGFPTFPQSTPNTRRAVQVPAIFNGANTNALRINDVTKIPVINHHTPPGEAPR